MTESLRPSITLVRVRFAETDAFGFAYHGAYFAWLESARAEWLRERGMTYRELMAMDVHLPVISTQVRFVKPVSYDDVIEVRTILRDWSGVRLKFEYQLRRQGEDVVLTHAATEHAAVDGKGRPRRFPTEVANCIASASIDSVRDTPKQ